MNEEERYLFDLQGYLHLENVIPPETLREMNDYIDARAEADPKWSGSTGNQQVLNPITWGPSFLALLDHPRILPILTTIMGDTVRLDHDYAIFLHPGHTGLLLHGATDGLYDHIHYYRCVNGEIISGLSVATFALNDVPPGAGGLAVIPGSHKANFPTPMDIRKFERESPIVKQIPMRAGDCVLFTEALMHGTLPWKGPGVRRTLFYKYAPGGVAWSNRHYLPAEEIADFALLAPDLTESQRRLLMPPGANDFRPWHKRR